MGIIVNLYIQINLFLTHMQCIWWPKVTLNLLHVINKLIIVNESDQKYEMALFVFGHEQCTTFSESSSPWSRLGMFHIFNENNRDLGSSSSGTRRAPPPHILLLHALLWAHLSSFFQEDRWHFGTMSPGCTSEFIYKCGIYFPIPNELVEVWRRRI